LRALRQFDAGGLTVEEMLEALLSYAELDPGEGKSKTQALVRGKTKAKNTKI